DEPLSFTKDEIISAIGLPICKDLVLLPPKETVRAELATLGLFDKDKPTLSSTVFVNSSPLKMKREVMAKFLEWSSGQATWSGGQDVGVVPKGLEWWPRVLLGAQGSNF
ncbi:hypothetical protein Tco_1331672, partial [Tanacetum coccineum]